MVLRAIEEIFTGPSKFDLLDLPGFPYEEFDANWSRYTEAERWFTGKALADQPENTGKTDLYPMRINPIVGTVMKHTAVLFGEVEDDARPLIVPKLQYNPKKPGNKEAAEHAEEVLNSLWWENKGRSMLIENGFTSQVYGGCVFKATYVPWEWDEYGGMRVIPIRIERISPKSFIGVPDASDNYNLIEAWIVREVGATEASLWGYTGNDENVWYIEHWLPHSVEILIDGKPASRRIGAEWKTLSGPNPWGFIPMVYIPHIRVGDFLGFNAYSHLVGMVKELNVRWGDFGDAINDDSHPVLAGRNINGSAQVKRITEWLEYVDLGSNPGISGSEPEPDLFQVNQARASSAMDTMVSGIMAQYRRDAYVPAVADGEDEGSQRSGLTLAIRFWPLTSHCNLERHFWTPGMDVFQKMLLRMMFTKGLAGITLEMTRMRIKNKWAPMLPRDREIDMNEWAVRSSNTIASFEHLVELAGDVEDIAEERKRTLMWAQDLEKAKLQASHEFNLELEQQKADAALKQAKEAPAPIMGGPPRGGGTGGSKGSEK